MFKKLEKNKKYEVLEKEERLMKKLKKLGCKTTEVVFVEPIYFDGAKPNRCNFNAIDFWELNKDYDLKVGYLLLGNEAVAHMWNFDSETGKHIDCTPIKAERKLLSYIDATNLLLPIYCKTSDMEHMPAYYLKRASIETVNYDVALQMSRLAKAS